MIGCDHFANRLKGYYYDNIIDIRYLLENDYMVFGYMAHGGGMFYVHKDFIWQGDRSLDGKRVFSELFEDEEELMGLLGDI